MTYDEVQARVEEIKALSATDRPLAILHAEELYVKFLRYVAGYQDDWLADIANKLLELEDI